MLFRSGAVKFEYASVVWLPVFCPGQPVVWVSSPRLLKRYKAAANLALPIPDAYTCSQQLRARQDGQEANRRTLFFNLGFMTLMPTSGLEEWIPELPGDEDINANQLVIVSDSDIGMIHDMALYRQSRVKLEDTMKKAADGSFFNIEALPEGSILVFPIAVKKLQDSKAEEAVERQVSNAEEAVKWHPFANGDSRDL